MVVFRPWRELSGLGTVTHQQDVGDPVVPRTSFYMLTAVPSKTHKSNPSRYTMLNMGRKGRKELETARQSGTEQETTADQCWINTPGEGSGKAHFFAHFFLQHGAMAALQRAVLRIPAGMVWGAQRWLSRLSPWSD